MALQIAKTLLPLALTLAGTGIAQAQDTLYVATGGSQNMVDYVTDYLGPMFEAQNPGWSVNVVGTGPGDAGSQAILEKLTAQKAKDSWDTDVIVTAQLKTAEMVKDGLLMKYRDDIDTGKLVTSDVAKNALGTDVDGYVMPMFISQTAIAYNPALVDHVPTSMSGIRDWAEAHKGAFGYNGIKNGMSGVAFTTAWIYAFGGDADVLMKGPYDKAQEAGWDKAFAALKTFDQSVTFTPGNAGTLDMLNRGEIAMGPVWVDMFYSWQQDGRLNPGLKITLPEPGMPGQPYYYAIPAKAAHAEAAKKFIALATSPEVQAEGIVKKFNWYPGIDASHLQGVLDQASWDKLFTDIPPETLAKNAKPFPLGGYFTDMLEQYETQVTN
ncbi:extracellular solute-binding protein [Pseudooceanicola sp. CBS1P-1]|uniref:Extracellular solute-binding protein n=1 Tax=Pseudooceanicola albus TaxID=2692189 RepID=A0A6L7G8D6_9RHOB|nr:MULTISPECIES: extracellular solute-binding protein [Pseudooceanicola]MBT9386292.1 extracellular solute-binding protein [Pseudooceanicola endophyticus]MXN20341.1 extracellular solute-binding protein [Pseudooceanicola albus]